MHKPGLPKMLSSHIAAGIATAIGDGVDQPYRLFRAIPAARSEEDEMAADVVCGWQARRVPRAVPHFFAALLPSGRFKRTHHEQRRLLP
jgi:hypothetical protein